MCVHVGGGGGDEVITTKTSRQLNGVYVIEKRVKLIGNYR